MSTNTKTTSGFFVRVDTPEDLRAEFLADLQRRLVDANADRAYSKTAREKGLASVRIRELGSLVEMWTDMRFEVKDKTNPVVRLVFNLAMRPNGATAHEIAEASRFGYPDKAAIHRLANDYGHKVIETTGEDGYIRYRFVHPMDRQP